MQAVDHMLCILVVNHIIVHWCQFCLLHWIHVTPLGVPGVQESSNLITISLHFLCLFVGSPLLFQGPLVSIDCYLHVQRHRT